MKRLLGVIALLVGIGGAQISQAYEWIDSDTVRVTMSWAEPTQNTDNSTLTDLKEIEIRYTTGNGLPDLIVHIEPASLPAGGATISVLVDVPPKNGPTTTFKFDAVSRTLQGMESDPSPVVALLVTRPKPKSASGLSAN